MAWRWLDIAGWKLATLSLAVLATALLVPDPPELAFSVGSLGLAAVLASSPGDGRAWLAATWDLTKTILPLLLVGVLLSGLMLGRDGREGLVPSAWVESAVGGDGAGATLTASVLGALMYFATLTEIPIVQGLMGSGMGKAPALALLLAGPALSLPSILVLRSIIGWRKTIAYVALVVLLSTVAGLVFAHLIARGAMP